MSFFFLPLVIQNNSLYSFTDTMKVWTYSMDTADYFRLQLRPLSLSLHNAIVLFVCLFFWHLLFNVHYIHKNKRHNGKIDKILLILQFIIFFNS